MEINITCRGQRIKILSRVGKNKNYRFQGTGVRKVDRIDGLINIDSDSSRCTSGAWGTENPSARH